VGSEMCISDRLGLAAALLGTRQLLLVGDSIAAVLELGAHAVELATVVGPFFITNPDEMFSLDRFHPSALGYRRTAKAILPSVLVALGMTERAPYGHHAP
jgi:hypothetical protein